METPVMRSSWEAESSQDAKGLGLMEQVRLVIVPQEALQSQFVRIVASIRIGRCKQNRTRTQLTLIRRGCAPALTNPDEMLAPH